MKKKLIVILITFLFLINISAFLTIAYNVFAIKDGQEPSAIREVLNLTEVQAKEIEGIRASFKTEVENAGVKLQEKKRELFLAMRENKPDKEHMYNLIDEISLLQAQLQKEAVERMVTEKSLLNSTQQERYFSAYGQRMGMGRMQGSGGQGYMKGGGRGKGMGRGRQNFDNNNF
ncbi:periplasmic heavy metal sensor [bacterium]|nr:periplasmic heavy metal sensor [bacterium]